MSLNNECTCKRVLVFPRVEERVSAIIMAQMPISSPNLENYYDKEETDDLLNEKLSTNELDNAIDQALLEAKESGDFKGEKGEQGIQGERGEKGEQGIAGKDGKNGANGISATHSWNGTTLTITSASGTSSANLKGERGEKGEKGEQGERGLQGEQGVQGIQGIQGIQGDKGDRGEQGIQGIQGEKGDKGDTPVKGTDYFTEADKQSFVAEITTTIEGLINQAIGEINNGTY